MSQLSVEELIAQLSDERRVAVIYNPHRSGVGFLGDTFEEYLNSVRNTMRIRHNFYYFLSSEEAGKISQSNVLWEVEHKPRDKNQPNHIKHFTVASTLRVALEHALNGVKDNILSTNF